MEGHETLRGRMNFEGRLLKKTCKFGPKKVKNDANLQSEKKQAKNALKNLIWERLGLRLGRVLGGFWRLLGLLGLF